MIWLTFSIAVYWARALACGRAELVQVLRKQLEVEVIDRAFLRDLAEKMNSGEQKFCKDFRLMFTSFGSKFPMHTD